MDFIGSNSYIVWLLILISVISLAIILERLFFFIRYKTERDDLVRDVIVILTDMPSTEKVKSAAQLCSRSLSNNPLAFIMRMILDNAHLTKEELTEMTEVEIEKQSIPFERFLTTLSTISTVSPLLGLLGTVVGMIRSFLVISQGDIEQSAVASGISEALITTAIGLIIAIPTTVFYNYFVRKTEKIIRSVSLGASEVISRLK